METFGFPAVLENCVCGWEHTCDVREVAVESGALSSVPRMLDGYGHVLLVYDNNTWDACAKQVAEILEKGGINASAMHFRQNGLLVPDEEAVNALLQAAGQDTRAIVGVGAGVINDLCKWVSYRLHIPYMIIATAPSMDGFASIGSALIVKGMKVTYNAQVPRWIVADTNVLRNAPMDMLRSGAGDILGKISSLNDWELSRIVNGESLCPEIYKLVERQIDICREDLALITHRDEQAVSRLMQALVTVGFCMSYVGNSRPASGSEHHLSHFFEVTGILFKKSYLSHGVDVIYSTAVTCALRRQLINMGSRAVYAPLDREKWQRQRQRVYGPLAPEVNDLQEKLGFYGNAARQQRQTSIQTQWAQIRRVLAEVPDEQAILEYIKTLGLDFREFTATYSSDGIQNAILFAKDLKDRYTLLWLMQDMGLLETLAETYLKTRDGARA